MVKKKKKRKESITNMLIKKREESYEILSENHKKESLAVQWLGLCAFTAVSSTPWLGTQDSTCHVKTKKGKEQGRREGRQARKLRVIRDKARHYMGCNICTAKRTINKKATYRPGGNICKQCDQMFPKYTKQLIQLNIKKTTQGEQNTVIDISSKTYRWPKGT